MPMDTTNEGLQEKLRAEAQPKRKLAWELLKQTRNAAYVALRYNYPLSVMQEALQHVEKEYGPRPPNTHPAGYRSPDFRRPEELLPETSQSTRVPGEDDDLGED